MCILSAPQDFSQEYFVGERLFINSELYTIRGIEQQNYALALNVRKESD